MTVYDSREGYRRRIVVTIESAYCAYVRGHGSRRIIEELRGRPPVWSATSRAWCVQETTARDVIAAAEARGYDVMVTTEAAVSERDRLELDETSVPVDEPEATLW